MCDFLIHHPTTIWGCFWPVVCVILWVAYDDNVSDVISRLWDDSGTKWLGNFLLIGWRIFQWGSIFCLIRWFIRWVLFS